MKKLHEQLTELLATYGFDLMRINHLVSTFWFGDGGQDPHTELVEALDATHKHGYEVGKTVPVGKTMPYIPNTLVIHQTDRLSAEALQQISDILRSELQEASKVPIVASETATQEYDGKPPVGLRPWFIMAEHRLAEVQAALYRYSKAGKHAPEYWYREQTELEYRLNNRQPGKPYSECETPLCQSYTVQATLEHTTDEQETDRLMAIIAKLTRQRDALLELCWLDLPDEPSETVEQWRKLFADGWERKGIAPIPTREYTVIGEMRPQDAELLELANEIINVFAQPLNYEQSKHWQAKRSEWYKRYAAALLPKSRKDKITLTLDVDSKPLQAALEKIQRQVLHATVGSATTAQLLSELEYRVRNENAIYSDQRRNAIRAILYVFRVMPVLYRRITGHTKKDKTPIIPEEAAKLVFGAMYAAAATGERPQRWQDGGNSDMQELARKTAKQILD